MPLSLPYRYPENNVSFHILPTGASLSADWRSSSEQYNPASLNMETVDPDSFVELERLQWIEYGN